MGFDSSAELLFTIGADSSGAENALQSFRSLFGNTLDGARTEFGDWVQGILSGSSSAEEALAGIGPAIELGLLSAAAAAAAFGASLVELGRHEAEFAESVEQGTRATGLSTEQLSGLDYAAQMAGVSSEKLNTSMVRFANAAAAAEVPTSKQALAFKALGLTQDDIAAGQKDLYGLLMKTMDAYSAHADGANKDAVSTALFRDRTASLIQFLDMGSSGLAQFQARAEETGNILSENAAGAAKQYTIAMADLKGELSGLALQIGEKVVPALVTMTIQIEGLLAISAKLATHKADWTDWLIPGAAVLHVWENGLKDFNEATAAAQKRILDFQQALSKPVGMPTLPGLHEGAGTKDTGKATQQTTDDFTQFSSILERVNVSLAGTTSEEAKVAAQSEQLQMEVQKAAAAFEKLVNEGKITPEVFERETVAFANLGTQIKALQTAKLAEAAQKQNQVIAAASADLRVKIEADQQKTYASQVALWELEIQKQQEKLQKERALTAENQELLDQLRQAGLDKIARQYGQLFLQQVQKLNESLNQMVQAHQTAEQKIEATYQQDLVRFSAAEEAKEKLTEADLAKANIIHLKYEQLRAAALLKYQRELQTLRNSQGWQGLFGNTFAQAIRGNEALWQQWASSTNQAMMMVQVAAEAMTEAGQQAFTTFANGMGQNISAAIVYKTSIADAMRSALASTLESLAAQAITYAIFSTALGFERLAERDFAAASQAFIAAGEFGLIGATAAVAGRMIAPASSSGSSGSSSGSSSAAAAGASSTASASSGGGSGSNQPMVTVIVQGHIIGAQGIDEVCSMINDAVNQRDVRLIATATKSDKTVLR